MVKTAKKSRIFAREKAKVLSIISSQIYVNTRTATNNWFTCTSNLNKLRYSDQSLSKLGLLFARDRRNVSSLTNGIGNVSGFRTKNIAQESMPRRPEVSESTHDFMSTSSILGTSGEQLTIAERRWS